MRIAIVGAGLAGLACAHELERLGFAPEIFTAGDRPGKPGLVVEVMMQFMHHQPRSDMFRYVQDELRLPLHPASAVNRMVLFSADETATISGSLGYTTIRGQDERSLDYQLVRHVQAPIHYHQEPDVIALSEEYDWVVVATGSAEWPRRFGVWEHRIAYWMIGAVVEGEFSTNELQFFFNTRYTKTGYGLISPLDERHASVGIGVPGSSADEAERYWQVFREEQNHRWEREVSQFRYDGVEIGWPRSHVIGNVLLTGLAGGFQEGLGTSGQCPSLASGVMAARQIALQDRSLERFARQWQVYNDRLWRLRRNVNAWTDREMNRLVLAARLGPSNWLAVPRWNLLAPAGVIIDKLGMADDYSPEVGWR